MTPTEQSYRRVPHFYGEPRPILEQPSDTAIRLIPLTRGKVAIVSSIDYDWLSQWKWTVFNGRYVRRTAYIGNIKRTIHMHREVLGLSPDDPRKGDHINHNPLDNRRENLRIATLEQNAQNARVRKDNTSGVKGINWNKECSVWIVRVQCGGVRRLVGRFKEYERALEALTEATKALHGEFACLPEPTRIQLAPKPCARLAG